MQTFLPYESFTKSAAVLDRQRLGKQRVENLQIMRALLDPSYGWQHHPATNMWRGHELYLNDYHIVIVGEWTDRGYKDTCLEKMDALMQPFIPFTDIGPPAWLGDEAFHASHRSNLLRKAPDHYRQYWPNDLDDLEYVWPTKDASHA